MLRQAGLAPYAFSVIPSDHAAHQALRPDYFIAFARHQHIKRAIVPLLMAWHDAGIEALIFKGFALNEFAYPMPGARMHGDVDILIAYQHTERALHIVRDHGWRHTACTTNHHNICGLISPEGIRIDLHRTLVPCYWPGWKHALRITQSVWNRSDEKRLTIGADHEVPVRILQPIDAWLVLALQRSWSGDNWNLKWHDVTDVRTFMNLGVTPDDLLARATEYKASKTAALFLQRCNPAAGTVNLALVTKQDKKAWNRIVRREREVPSQEMHRWIERARLFPKALRSVPSVVPLVKRLGTAFRRGLSASEILSQVRLPTIAEPPYTLQSINQRHDLYLKALWGVRFVHGRAQETSLRSKVHAALLFILLRRHGFPAVYVSGINTTIPNAFEEAWVELHGHQLEDVSPPLIRSRFRITETYPAEPD